MQIKILNIAQELGICPQCLFADLAERELDTFTSLESLKRIIEFDNYIKAREPVSRNNSWIYYCADHFKQNDEIEVDEDQTVEILDVF